MHDDEREKPLATSISETLSKLRPFANREMIYKPVQGQHGSAVFIIDPWNQRWIIAQEPIPALLRLADGKQPLTTILRTLQDDPQCSSSLDDLVGMVRTLSEFGLLFANREEHSKSGLAVYNACEPVGLHLEITNLCNLTCTHCYVSAGRKLPNELTIEEIYRVIDMLPPFSGKRIAISGGEPALHKECGAIIEYCAITCGHNVDLYSNGKKFPRSLADRIIEINQQDAGKVRIQISLEGATAESNDRVRGVGSFNSVMKTLEMFRPLGLTRSVVLFVCITQHNIDEIDALIRLAEEQDVAMLVFSQWQKQGYASDTPWASISPSHQKWVEAGEKLLNYSHPRLQVFGNFFGDLNNNEYGRFALESSLFPKQLYFYNAFPRVTPDGFIFADQLWVDPAWRLGNVREMTLTEAFQSPKFFDQLNQMRKRTQHIPKCQACEWRALCEGGSSGHTYAEYGTMHQPDLFCDARIAWFNRYVDEKVKKALDRT